MDVPKEALVDIFLNLSLDEVSKNCRLNKRSASICNSNEFWRRYLQKHYYIDKPVNNAKELVMRIDKHLKALWKRNLYPSYRYPLLIAEVGDIPNLTGNLIYETDSLVTVSFRTNSGYDKIFEKIVNIEFEPDETITTLDDEKGRKEYTRALKLILRPTIYLTPNGPKVVNFDSDAFEILGIKFYQNIDLGENFSDRIFNIKEAMYLINFT